MGQVLLWCLILVALPAAIVALIWTVVWSPRTIKPVQPRDSDRTNQQ